MTIAVKLRDGIITFNESKAECPHCERDIPFEEIEPKYMKQSKDYIRMKCKCKRYIGITTDMKGDYRAYELAKSVK